MTCPKCGGEVRIIDDTPMCRTCDLPLSNVTWERRSTQDYVYAGPERRADCRYTAFQGPAIVAAVNAYPAALAVVEALDEIAGGRAFKQDADGTCISDAVSVARAALATWREAHNASLAK